jgi:hypothetical protein
MTFKFNKLALGIAAGALSTFALADGRVNGRVSDQAQNNYFEGAIVRIDELNLQTSTSEDGRFNFNNVPAGDYKLSVSYRRISSKIFLSPKHSTPI